MLRTSPALGMGPGGSVTMAKKSTTGRSARKPDPEMYQIYVRVPGDRDDSVVTVRKFLKEIAALLSDETREVTVVPYEGYDASWTKAAKTAATAATAKRATSKTAAAKKAVAKKTTDAPDPEGGRSSPLYPLYVCHNKF
jgi:hypothetical protein